MNKLTHNKQLTGAFIAWLLASFFLLYQFLLQTSPSVMVPQLATSFDTNSFGVSLLSSSFFYTYIVLQIPMGLLIDRVNIRPAVTISLILLALMTLGFALSHSYLMAEIFRILMGLVAGASLVSAFYIAGKWFPAYFFAILAGLTEFIAVYGNAAGQIILAHSVTVFGWRSTMVACAIFGLVLAGLCFAFIKEQKENPYQQKHKVAIWESLKIILGNKQAWLFGIVSGFMFAILSGFGGLWCIPFLQNTYHLDLRIASTISAMIFFGAGTSAPILALISNKIGRRVLPMQCGAVVGLIVSSIIVFTNHLSVPSLLALMFLLGAAGGTYVLPFALMKDVTDSKVQGAAMGFINMLSILIGAPLMQPLIGAVLHFISHDGVATMHDYRIALSVIPLTMILAIVLNCFVKETFSKSLYII